MKINNYFKHQLVQLMFPVSLAVCLVTAEKLLLLVEHLCCGNQPWDCEARCHHHFIPASYEHRVLQKGAARSWSAQSMVGWSQSDLNWSTCGILSSPSPSERGKGALFVVWIRKRGQSPLSRRAERVLGRVPPHFKDGETGWVRPAVGCTCRGERGCLLPGRVHLLERGVFFWEWVTQSLDKQSSIRPYRDGSFMSRIVREREQRLSRETSFLSTFLARDCALFWKTGLYLEGWRDPSFPFPDLWWFLGQPEG